MRLTAVLGLAALGLILTALWASGVFASIAFWAAGQQSTLQSALAGDLQALRRGTPAAFWSLILLSFSYGFLHALGPGHGKALIAGAAVGSRATAARMALIALLGSLAQAAVAIFIVFSGFALLGATARGTIATSEAWIAPAGNLMIAGIGLWLLVSGLRGLPSTASIPAHAHDYDHDHHDHHHHPDDAHGACCAHNHGPTATEAASATSLGAMLALIGGMAARPCTGALILLVIAWRFDLRAAGAAAVIAMGLGTASFTVAVAVAAVASRDAAFLSLGDSALARYLGPALRIIAGGLVLAISLALLLTPVATTRL